MFLDVFHDKEGNFLIGENFSKGCYLKFSFLNISCFRNSPLELSMTLGARSGIWYGPGMAFVSAIGRFLEAPWSVLGCYGHLLINIKW